MRRKGEEDEITGERKRRKTNYKWQGFQEDGDQKLVKASSRKIPPLSSCLLYQVPKKAKLFGTVPQAISRQHLGKQQTSCLPSALGSGPQVAARLCRGGTYAGGCGGYSPPQHWRWPPARTLSHPRAVAQLTARTALRWHVCTASHATHMAVRAPSSTTEDGSLPGTLPQHLHPATARQPRAPMLEKPGLQETSPMPPPYSIACTSPSDIPLPCSPKHHLLSRSPLLSLPPVQGLSPPSPWKLQQRQLVTARSSRLHVHLSWLGLTHESNIITNMVAALACQEVQLGLCHSLHTSFPVQQ